MPTQNPYINLQLACYVFWVKLTLESALKTLNQSSPKSFDATNLYWSSFHVHGHHVHFIFIFFFSLSFLVSPFKKNPSDIQRPVSCKKHSLNRWKYSWLSASALQDVEANTVQSAETSEESQIDKWSALFWLAVLTILISILSEYLVDAIQVL